VQTHIDWFFNECPIVINDRKPNVVNCMTVSRKKHLEALVNDLLGLLKCALLFPLCYKNRHTEVFGKSCNCIVLVEVVTQMIDCSEESLSLVKTCEHKCVKVGVVVISGCICHLCEIVRIFPHRVLNAIIVIG
jgi:hypothetical protein